MRPERGGAACGGVEDSRAPFSHVSARHSSYAAGGTAAPTVPGCFISAAGIAAGMAAAATAVEWGAVASAASDHPPQVDRRPAWLSLSKFSSSTATAPGGRGEGKATAPEEEEEEERFAQWA